MAARSKAWLCSRSLAGIAGSIPPEVGMSAFSECFLSYRREMSATGRSVVERSPAVCVCVCQWVWSGATVTLYTYTDYVDQIKEGRKSQNLVTQNCNIVQFYKLIAKLNNAVISPCMFRTVNDKVKSTLEQAMNTHRGTRSVALLFL